MTKPVKDQVDTVKKVKKFKEVTENPVYRTVAGGVVGAGIGYALNPKLATKTLIKHYPKEKMKETVSLRSRANDLRGSLLSDDKKGKKKKKDKKGKKKNGLFGLKKSKNDKRNKKGKKKGSKKQYQSLKLENESLQQRLQFLEDKFDQYASSKKRKKSLFGRKK